MGNNFSALDREQWMNLQLEVNKTKAAYMHAFKSAVERQQRTLNTENLLGGLWIMESRFGGMGGKYDPVLWWRLNTAGRDSLRIQFEVGDGLKLKKGHLTLARLGAWIPQIKELFTAEAGWYISHDAVMRNNSVFGIPQDGGFKGAAREIWLLGKEPERYAGMLCEFIRPYLTDQKVIRLFKEIDAMEI
jgi:hypothetical protein